MPVAISPASIAVVILAGGRGARLGGINKPLLRRADGRTLLAGVIEALAPVGRELLVITTKARAAEIQAAFGGRVAIDPGLGPAEALGRAASEVTGEWIALAGGDHPHPAAEIFARLGEAAGEGVNAVVASLAGQRQPLCALYRRAAVAALAARRSLAGGSLQAVLDDLSALVVDADPWPKRVRSGFHSVNTPEDARAAGLSDPCAPSEGAG